jgi:predicted nucleic acid-binding protein
MIVVDANILIRAVLGTRVRRIFEAYRTHGLRFYAPDVALTEAATHLPVLLKRSGRSDKSAATEIEYLTYLIDPIEQQYYSLAEYDARRRLRNRDEDDWPVLACVLRLACPLWTEDRDFFGTGVATWTTDRVEIFLEEQAKSR